MNNQLQILQHQDQLILNKLDSIQNDKKKIEALSIMNSELLQKLQYHEQTNFTEFSNNVNKYFTTFSVGYLNYFISNYYLNILRNIWNIRNLPYINKFFKVFDLILILWKKYLLGITFVSWYFINTKTFRNIEILFIIIIIIIILVEYINFKLDTEYIVLAYKKSCD
jgi:hypothetical protein